MCSRLPELSPLPTSGRREEFSSAVSHLRGRKGGCLFSSVIKECYSRRGQLSQHFWRALPSVRNQRKPSVQSHRCLYSMLWDSQSQGQGAGHSFTHLLLLSSKTWVETHFSTLLGCDPESRDPPSPWSETAPCSLLVWFLKWKPSLCLTLQRRIDHSSKSKSTKGVEGVLVRQLAFASWWTHLSYEHRARLRCVWLAAWNCSLSLNYFPSFYLLKTPMMMTI